MREIQVRFNDSREYIENRLRQGRLVDTPDQMEEFPAVQFGLPSVEIGGEEQKGSEEDWAAVPKLL